MKRLLAYLFIVLGLGLFINLFILTNDSNAFLFKPCKKITKPDVFKCTYYFENDKNNTGEYIGQIKKVKSFKHKQPHGFGKMMFLDGTVYEGGWSDGLMDGRGVITYTHGAWIKFEGKFRKHEPYYGKIYYRKSGTIYEGEIKNNVPHGNGSKLYKDGTKIVGKWANNKRIGDGKKITKSGEERFLRTKLSNEAFKCFKEKDYNCSYKKFSQDTKQSNNLYSQADSKYWLALHYLHGLGRDRNPPKGLKLIEEMYNSKFKDLKEHGIIYLQGSTFTNIPQLIDGKKAIKYNNDYIEIYLNNSEKYKKDHKHNLDLSYSNLAYVHQYGIDTKKDLKKSYEYFIKSNSYIRLGLFHLLGLGPVDASKEEATKYFKKVIDFFEDSYSDEKEKEKMNKSIKSMSTKDKERGWIGVLFSDTNEMHDNYVNYLNKGGSYVENVSENSPGYKAEIKIGDIVTHLNDNRITSQSIIMDILREKKPGDITKLKIWREGNVLNKEVTLGKFNPSQAFSKYDYSSNIDYITSKSLINLLESYNRLPADYLELTDWVKNELTNQPELVIFLSEMYMNYDYMQSYVWNKIALDSYKELKFEKKNTKKNQLKLLQNLAVLEKKFLTKNEIQKAKKISIRKKDVLLAEIKDGGQLIVKKKIKSDLVKADKIGPIIEVVSNIKSKTPEYTIKGKVKDKDSEVMTLHVNGEPVSIDNKGNFVISRFNPSGETLNLKAWDEWANSTSVSVTITVEKQLAEKKDFLEPLKLPSRKVKKDNNKVAIVIGIENYENAPKATYANKDAEFFSEYLKRSFGVVDTNMMVIQDNEAKLIKLYGILAKWLAAVAGGGGKDIYIFYSGHGLSSNDGKDLYLLTHDSDPDLLNRTAILRKELFELINKQKPKSVTMFFDTCYSGVTRDEELLLASARPIRIIADDDKEIPDNFTIFSASKLDQISSGLKKAKHGIFSYYLMKGLEGKADSNKDYKITNGELLAYMNQNVSQKASELGRQQNPSLAGDPDKILVSYR